MEVYELEQILFAELGYADKQELLHDDEIPWSNGRRIDEINAAVFLKNIPIAYFSRLTDLNPNKIKELHKKIWSQSKAPLLFITLPHEIRIYNCYEPTPAPGNELDSSSRLLQHITNLSDQLTAQRKIRAELVQANHYERIYLETGEFWNTESGKKINHQNRADRHLIDGMAYMRKTLISAGLSNHIAYTLLGRSIFIRYLEDRGALLPSMTKTMTDGKASSYQEALKNRSTAYKLFRSLSERFNGDLFPVEDDEKKVTDEHLELLFRFLQGDNLDTGQFSLWPFNFEFVPIELISHIYDTFIEDQRSSGAYYTPLLLADFVLEETMGDDVIQHTMTCLDPACGSGIFLVGAYRRLIQAWKRSHKGYLRPETLSHILQKQIFGIDKHREAVRIAAFSLYLEILNHLTNVQIQNENFQFPPLLSRNLISSDFFSEFIDKKFNSIKFDRVIGNMPWGRGTISKETKDWLSRNKLTVGGKQAAPAFMLRAPQFSKEAGEIAFIAPAKSTILVTSKPHQQFRNNFFSTYSVRAVVNFSALVYDLFQGAISPAVAVFYGPESQDFDEKLIYATPKPSPLFHHIKAILLDLTEIKFLDKREVRDNPNLWKIAMWGTPRDAALLQRFSAEPTLDEQAQKLGLQISEGYSIKQKRGKPTEARWLTGLPLLPTDKFNRWIVRTSGTVNDVLFERPRQRKVYKAPLVLIHHSKCSAAYKQSGHVAYKNKISGVVGKKGQEQILKWLMAYVNSPFVKYYHFLTSTSWAVERNTIIQGEYKRMPFPIPETTDPNFKELLSLIDRLFNSIQAEETFFVEQKNLELKKLEGEINLLVYKLLGIHHTEQQLITDMLMYNVEFSRWANHTKRGVRELISVRRPDISILKDYADTFSRAVSSVLKIKQQALSATVYNNGAPLTVVSFSFTGVKNERKVEIITQPDSMRRKLRELDDLLVEQRTPSMYMRRHVRIYDGNQISLVRPSERRFWTQTQARVDADSFLADLAS